MFNVILIQAATLLLVSIGAALVGGVYAALSAFLGGGASLVPNLFFALRLQRCRQRVGRDYWLRFMLNELSKMGLTLVLIIVSAFSYTHLHWPSFMIALASVSLIILFALMKKTKTDKNYVDN